MKRDADLLQVVGATGASGRLAGMLHGGQQERDQNPDDGDHDEQLDQRETAAPVHGAASSLELDEYYEDTK